MRRDIPDTEVEYEEMVRRIHDYDNLFFNRC